MATVAELLDQGVKAYTRGESVEAERFWEQALEMDPKNERVRAYLKQVRGELPPRPGATPPEPEPTPPPEPVFAPSPWDAGPTSVATVVVEEGAGLDLDAVGEKSDIRSLVPDQKPATKNPAPGEVTTWMEGARELFALGDFSGSLEMIERILLVDPTTPRPALTCARTSRPWWPCTSRNWGRSPACHGSPSTPRRSCG